MQVLQHRVALLDDNSKYHSYVLDGILPASGPNQIVFPVDCFQNNHMEMLLLFDRFYVGLNFMGANTWTNNPITLELNRWRKLIGPDYITDANDQNADFPQAMPIGFNQFSGSGPQDYARWSQDPKAIAFHNETLAIVLRIKFGASGGQANYPKVTLQFCETRTHVKSQ